MNNSVNPSGNIDFRAEYNVSTDSVGYQREPPPPYTRDAALDEQPPSIIHQTIIVQAPLKSTPMFYMCPQCRQRVLTKVKYVSSKGTHMLAGFICGLTLWCFLCCLSALPYYFHMFKKAQHYCPNCDELLGEYSKI